MVSSHLLQTDAEIAALLPGLKRIAILGIKPERDNVKPAHYVPKALQVMGLQIIPVAATELGVTEILGCPVYRTVRDVPGTLDLVDVFRRPVDLPAHLPDLLAAKPKAVWLQLGIRDDAFASALADAGIDVVQDRCLMVDYRRFTGPHR